MHREMKKLVLVHFCPQYEWYSTKMIIISYLLVLLLECAGKHAREELECDREKELHKRNNDEYRKWQEAEEIS